MGAVQSGSLSSQLLTFTLPTAKGPAPKSWVRMGVFHPTYSLNTPYCPPQLGLRALDPEEAGGGL